MRVLSFMSGPPRNSTLGLHKWKRLPTLFFANNAQPHSVVVSRLSERFRPREKRVGLSRFTEPRSEGKWLRYPVGASTCQRRILCQKSSRGRQLISLTIGGLF